MNITLYQDEDCNAIRLSRIRQYEGDIAFKHLAIKFVISGKEIYHIKGEKYTVQAGEYLIGNSDTTSTISIQGKEEVQGLCIDISPKIMAEVMDSQSVDAENLTNFLFSKNLLVSKYQSKHTFIGNTLLEITEQLQGNRLRHAAAQHDVLYRLAESVVIDLQKVQTYLSKIEFKKEKTNEIICKKLLYAKFYIEENACQSINIDTIAQEIGLSKSHFLRLFKQVFGISPYQYLLHRKMEAAQARLRQGCAIKDLAHEMAFADTAAFSKAFKLIVGVSPSALLPK